MGTFGVGNGAVFQLVGLRYRDRIGTLTGIVGAAGGLGGFFLPTLLGTARDAFGSYGPGLGVIAVRGGGRAGRGPRPAGRARGGARMRTLVIGGGIAGQAVVEAVRERDPDLELTLACAEPRLPYDRVALSTLLASGADPDTLTLRPASWYEDHRIDVRLEHPRRSASRATTATSCAPGSDALVPPIPGAEHAHVFRGPEDCAAIAAAAHGRAVVIGGGLLGLEAAHGLAALGCETTVVHLMDRLMERQLDAGAAALLAPAMEALGVNVLLERNTEEITPGRRPARRRGGAAGRPRRHLGRHPPADERSRAPPGSPSSAGSSSTTRSSPPTRACSRSASAPSTAASCTGSSRRSTSRRRSPPRRSAASTPPTPARSRRPS